MSTTFKTGTKMSTDTASASGVMNLPYMQHFNVDNLKTSDGQLKPGAKMIFHFLLLLTVVGTLYGLGVYALPIIFVAVGKIIAIALSVTAVVFAYLARRPFFMLLEGISRNLHKFAIRQDPFRILDKAREGQLENKRKFQLAQSKISTLKSQTESEALQSEQNANEYQDKIQRAFKKAAEIKEARAALLANGGTKDSDEYVELDKEWMIAVSDGNRLENKYQQAKTHTITYGSRAAVMGSLDRKLVLVGTSIDIKIDDFDATIEILKKEFEYAKNARLATETAKDAMLFANGWELDYALEVVTNTIIDDIANTAANLKDIDDYTKMYGVDSDELYANLEKTANNIKIGSDVAPSARKYKATDYKLTSEDKKGMKGFENIF
jgi:hypothetical protein